MVLKTSNLKHLRRSIDLIPITLRTKAEEVLELYKERKINQFRSAENLILNLRVGNKAAVQNTIAKIDAFKDRTPITGVIQRTNQKLADRSNALRLSKAIRTLRGIKQVNDANRIQLEVLDVKTAYHRRVLNITVRPVQIGAIAATDVSAIIAKSYLLALKEIPKKCEL